MAGINDIIGNYRLVKELASGAFGRVYQAEHIILTNRTVAIKLLYGAHLDSLKDRESFLQEARLLEMLKHPYILPIIDVGIHEGFPYLVVEYAPNGSLRNYLQRQSAHSIREEEIYSILSQVGQALQHAHEEHIIPRDLKPENILFNARGEALLADFGVATVLSTMTINYNGTVIGTPAYMAPEQFRGAVSKESD
jgi:serine/threonine protein kinase